MHKPNRAFLAVSISHRKHFFSDQRVVSKAITLLFRALCFMEQPNDSTKNAQAPLSFRWHTQHLNSIWHAKYVNSSNTAFLCKKESPFPPPTLFLSASALCVWGWKIRGPTAPRTPAIPHTETVLCSLTWSVHAIVIRDCSAAHRG